jgi:hypothetical protein
MAVVRLAPSNPAQPAAIVLDTACDPSDPARSPEFYDATFPYLTQLGIPALP